MFRRLILIGTLLSLCLAGLPALAQTPDPDRQLADKIRSDVQKKIGKTDADDDDSDLYLSGDGKPAGKGKQSAVGIDPRHIVAAPMGDRLNLTTPWLFNAGSENDFASPTYDDSAWKAIDTNRNLLGEGFFNVNDVWYRAHVVLAPGTHDLALTIADFGGSYRVYANGVELGGHGRMTGRGDYLIARSATYPIPDSALNAHNGELVLAIHGLVGTIDRASFTRSDGLTSESAVYLGSANLLWRDQQTYFDKGLRESPAILALWAVLLLLALALTFLIPKTPIYPILAVIAGGHLLARLLNDAAEFHYYSRTTWINWPIDLALTASYLAVLEFCRNIAGLKRSVWFSIVEGLYLVAQLSIFFAGVGWTSYLVAAILTAGAKVLLTCVASILIFVGVRRHKQDANIVAATAGLYVFYLITWKSLSYITWSFAILTRAADGFVQHVQPLAMLDLAIIAGYLAVILVRTLRQVRDRANIANEIEAARTMQQLLLAGSDLATPGFMVESIYLPAGEVGGDFFLISPCVVEGQEPSLTVIVGDVSGKGLRAAMRVSMILGVLRREPSREPAAMLRGLNDALLDGGDTGFTTACCVRLSPDGRFTAANAGHIPPYRAMLPGATFYGRRPDAEELVTPPALPLGLAPDQDYEVLEGQLQPGQKLVLLSDGVLEARSHKGELLGFERLGPLTHRPAAEIAKTAQVFGQDDDITVVTIACTPRTTFQPPPPPPPPAPPPRP